MINRKKRNEIEKNIKKKFYNKKIINKKKLEREGKKAAEEGLMSLVEQRR